MGAILLPLRGMSGHGSTRCQIDLVAKPISDIQNGYSSPKKAWHLFDIRQI
jgi:hypothetical protein